MHLRISLEAINECFTQQNVNGAAEPAADCYAAFIISSPWSGEYKSHLTILNKEMWKW